MTWSIHLGAVLLAVLLTGVGQVFVKKASVAATTRLRIFANWRLILGYTVLFGQTMTLGYALRGMPLGEVAAWQTLTFPVTTVMGAIWLGEGFGRREAVGLGLLVVGLVVFAMA